GTTFLVAVTTSTGTARAAFWRGACAPAPPSHKPLRVAATAQPAATSTTTAPATTICFFITAPRRPSIGPPRLPLFSGARSYDSFYDAGTKLLSYPYEPPSQKRSSLGLKLSHPGGACRRVKAHDPTLFCP